jgi:hypothetical protein
MVDTYLEITESTELVVEEDDAVVTVTVVEAPTTVVVSDDGHTVTTTQTQIETVSVGTQGPPGASGADGVDGGSYYHIQAGVSDTWTVTHNLGYRPNVTAFNSADGEVEGDVVHNSVNDFTITFTSAFSGYAVCS